MAKKKQSTRTVPQARGARNTRTGAVTVAPSDSRAGNDNRWVVRGRVIRADGAALDGAVVRAFDVDFRSEQVLGESKVLDAHYEIVYSRERFVRAEKRSADLRVRVFLPDRAEPVAQSPIYFSAPREAIVDLTADPVRVPRPSEYERHMTAVTALIGRVSPAELTEEDIKFVAGVTRIGSRVLALLVVAHQHAREMGEPPTVFYGLFRQGLPTNLPALLLVPTRLLRLALTRSVSLQIVPRALRRDIGRLIDALAKARVERLLDPRQTSGMPLRDLLESSGVPRPSQEKFLALYFQRESPEEFWRSLARAGDLPDDQVEHLRVTLQLAFVTQNNVPLVTSLKARVRTLADLADFDGADWERLIKEAGGTAPLPPDLPGDTRDEQIASYVGRIVETLSSAIPTAYVRRGVERDRRWTAERRTDLLRFFANVPEFDFRDGPIDHYLATHEDALNGVADRAAARVELKRLQRLFRIAPRYEQMSALLDRGLDSAAAVAAIPRTTFMQELGDALGGIEQAQIVYAKSQQAHAAAVNTYGWIHQAIHDFSPAAIGQAQPSSLSARPDWEQLFGALDFCECRHCRSVYGPAAYLVDLLQFLRKSGPPFTQLMKRRPDLEHIPLTCANTNTPVPIVDLVIEILDFYIVHGAFADMTLAEREQKAQELAKDTGEATVEELSVNPQYPNEQANAVLTQKVFSFALPFFQPLETARAYLEHLGSSRYEVMSLFQNQADPNSEQPSDLALACERLGISANEYDILIGQASNAPRELFGYPADSVTHINPDGTSLVETWRANLARVPEFLRRTGITYDDVVELLRTRFVNPVQTEPFPPDTVVLFSPEGVCDLTRTWIQRLASDHTDLDATGLSDATWVALHRFLRLRHRLGCSLRELDRARIVFATGIDQALVEDLAQLVRLQRRLNQPIDTLLAFWASIDGSSPDALFDRLFQNKRVTNPVDPAFALDATGSELADTSGTLTAHAATILAALRLSADDLARLREATGLSGDAESLSLGKLSLLYRHVLLARTLELRIRDLLSLVALAGVDPFANTAATVAFVERVDAVKASPASPPLLNYLFRHVVESGHGAGPTQDEILIVLASLQQSLRDIIDATQADPDPTGDLLRQRLALTLEPGLVEQAMAIIERTSSLPMPEQEQFIDDHFAVFLDPIEAKSELLALSSDPDEKAQSNRNYVWPRLLAHIRQVESASLVKQVLSTALPLDAALLQPLIEEILPSRLEPLQHAIADFLSLPDVAVLDDRIPDYVRLHKVALLLSQFKARPEEVRYLAEHGADFGGLDLSALPLDRSDGAAVDASAPGLFAQWERLRRFFELRDRLPERDLTLLDVLGAPSIAQARSVLGELAGWDLADVELLSGPQGLALSDASFKDATGPHRLWTAFRESRRLGISVAQLNAWAKQPPSAGQTQEIVHAVKARYDDEQWLEVGKTLNDGLREKRKQALIACVLADPRIVAEGIRDANGLFEYFLIDVAMDPCMMTSRIKQAGLSVQLFVQRCLLNLEKGASASSIDADRWAWMKNYRLWEANRKVFLYPENWIEPELRDGKSPFFNDLETQLLQSELTDENVELGLMSYLEKLADVGTLEAVGLYHQGERSCATKIDIVHAVARSYNTPKHYYYRRYDAIKDRWSAWEKIPADIEGDHVIPVLWNRRLYLFWPVFQEAPDKAATDSYLPDGVDPLTKWEIRIAWSERRQTGWSAKRLSDPIVSSVRHKVQDNEGSILHWFYLPKREEHYFRVSIDDGELKIRCGRRYVDGLDFWIMWLPDDEQVVVKVNEESPHRFTGHQWVGSFRFTGCGDQVIISDADSSRSFDVLKEPENTFNRTMGFQATSKAAHLTLRNADHTDVLRQIDGRFHFLASPAVNDLSKTYYPFFYQDPKRVYFVMPTLDDPRLIYMAVQNPVFYSPLALDYAPVQRIPMPDMGDPAPLDSVRAAATFLRGLGAADGPTRTVLSGSAPIGPGHRLISLGGRSKAMSALLGAMRVDEGQTMTLALSGDADAAEATSPSEMVAINPSLQIAKTAVLYLKFHAFFHPHVCTFMQALNAWGIPGLLTLANQELTNDPANDTVFDDVYDPAPKVHDDYPKEDVDFRPEGAYSLYNWELFFHAPLLIAGRLSQDQRFEQAIRWFHYIFDPTSSSPDPAPARYWKVLPFHENDESGRIEDYLALLHDGTPAQKKKVTAQIKEWRENPFNPHLIARSRLMAYQKTVVMKYIETLINWGDQLFARDTMESINEATQLYVLAYHILGRRPEQMPPRTKPQDKTYSQLKPSLDAFSNAVVELENAFPFTDEESIASSEETGAETLGTSPAFYFCIPPNEKLLKYWDTVADRLFKIRHCMTIEGVERQLPLFEPPIDPALLVKAAAAGLDLGSVLADLYAPLPHYRFQMMVHKAQELCAEVKSLGAALLSALEKKDAEALGALRAGHETALLELVREVKQRQLQEARTSSESLVRSRALAEERRNFYSAIEKKSQYETDQLDQLSAAQDWQAIGQVVEIAAGLAGIVPGFSFGGAGSMGSPLTSVSYGGSNVASGLQAHARSLSLAASVHSYKANKASLEGAWERRWADWKLQERLAIKEIAQLDKQIAAAEIRVAIVEAELSNHETQIDQAKTTEEFLRTKFTSQQLYGWMLSQVSAVHFQAYKLAYDAAKRAERAFRFERGLSESNFVQFGYWDSLKKGLLAGESLLLDLKRMEMAYLEQNSREYELVKHVSLRMHDPHALIRLKETGTCVLSLPEALFDADYPGHYFRRIKSLSVTIPCVVGPYVGVNCTFTLLHSKTRVTPTPAAPYGENLDDEDTRFAADFTGVRSVATSHAQNDHGMFELSFRDERYLPFEGAGAISEWRIDLSKDTNNFDVDTISDVVMHLKFTARDGGKLLREEARKSLRQLLADVEETPLVRLFSARHEFPNEWHHFLYPTSPTGDQTLTLMLAKDRFPLLFRGQTLTVHTIELLVKVSPQFAATYETSLHLALQLGGGPSDALSLSTWLGLLYAKRENVDWEVPAVSTNQQVDWTTTGWLDAGGGQHARLDPKAIEDLFVVCRYTCSSESSSG